MVKSLKVIVVVVFLLSLVGCSIRTPEIRGVVLDEETRRPVEGAWVHATLELKTKTIQGNVYNVLSVDRPHTRTGSDGRFMIPSRKFKKPLPPVGFGTEVMNFDINAKTFDRIGGIQFDLNDLKKKGMVVTIYIRSIEKIYNEQYQKYLKEGIKEERALELIERDQFSSLQSLYRYCHSGRFSVEVPPVEGGCDDWELDYAIAKHEKYLKKYRIIAEEGKARGYFAALDQLSELYEKKGDFKKAIEPLKEKIFIMERRGLLMFQEWRRDKIVIEKRISELQQKLEGVKK